MPSLPSLALRDARDRLAVVLSVLPLAAMLAVPSPWITALAVWWLGNTVSHQAVHRCFFADARTERVFSAWLSLLLGVPQRLWRQLHLAHHAERPWRWRWDAMLVVEFAVLVTAWWMAARWSPQWLLAVYAPGLGLGLVLAFLHGHFEHRGGTTSVHARWWNVCMLNDGYHVEHHAAPGRHWRDLPAQRRPEGRRSPLPPLLRWLPAVRPAAWLDAAERLVLRSAWLRARVLAAHRRALAAVLRDEPAPHRVVIVGGGLFPRSALLLRELYPRAHLVVLDADAGHLAAAAPWLPERVEQRVGRLLPGTPLPADLVVLPLALRGARAAFLAAPPAPRLLVHDWAWHRWSCGRVVAWWLGKRVYLVHSARVVTLAATA